MLVMIKCNHRLQHKVTTQIVAERDGFTLVELSIVLVIIGLIVGGVMVGQNMIESAKIRAAVSQIEQYSTAVNTFRLKYNSVPGDMSASNASSVGFATRVGTAGRGDGNGKVEGGSIGTVGYPNAGETSLFWNDLGASGLIEGSFKGIDCARDSVFCTRSSATVAVSQIFPPIKIGNNNYMTVVNDNGITSLVLFGNLISVSWAGGALLAADFNGGNGLGLTPVQAYSIDLKIDDGFPLTGSISGIGTAWDAVTIGPLLVGVPSANRCGNSSTTPTSYNIAPPYGAAYICGIMAALK